MSKTANVGAANELNGKFHERHTGKRRILGGECLNGKRINGVLAYAVLLNDISQFFH